MPICFDCLQGLGQGEATIEAEPSSRVPVPLDVEPIAAYPVEARERAVKLLAEVLREA